MKKAFTLVELLVVVVVISILAGVAFKLGGLGSPSVNRSKTIARMQRLENCLSGYFAAYGSYPPVDLQGRSRNFYYKANSSGIQQTENDDPDTSEIKWERVEAACRAQPVAVEFPFRKGMHQFVKEVSNVLVERGNEKMVFDALDNPAKLDHKKDENSWQKLQLFKFGLLSYLLPRYLVMMGYGTENGTTDTAASENLYNEFVQWGDNNSMPCKFTDGQQYESWSKLNEDLGKDDTKWMVAALPSQAVTARWLPNLAGILTCRGGVGSLYGVSVGGAEGSGIGIENPPPATEVYSTGDSQSGEGSGKSQPYILDKITCLDGWNHEFYYYSPPPYQSYRLWSAGENGKTFPPWIPDEDLEELEKKAPVRTWLADDIVHMSN